MHAHVTQNELPVGHLLHLERLATIGLMTTSITHDLNNMVTGISGGVQLLMRYWSVLEQHLEPAQRVDRVKNQMPSLLSELDLASDRMVSLFRTLNSLAKMDVGEDNNSKTGKPAGHILCQVNDCIENAVILSKSVLKQVHIILYLDSNLSPVYGVPQQLEQVFLNLFINAVQAMESLTEPGKLTISSYGNRESVNVVVEDTGPGFSPEQLENVWKPFFTTKKHGTGLGLSIVKSIVEGHGGAVSVENRPGCGARFQLSYPLVS